MLEVVQNSETKEFPIVVSSAEYPLTITWRSFNKTLAVSLMNNGSPTDMTSEGSAAINQPATSLALKVSAGRSAPTGFALHPGYPNPFNPSAAFSYDLPQAAFVLADIYDLLGREVRTLVAGNQPPGTHSFRWDGTAADGAASPSSIYFVRLSAVAADEAGTVFTATQKIMLMR